MASKFRPSEGFIRDRYSTASLPVEIHELLERERIPDDVARHVLDGLPVLEGDRLADMGREARMSPHQELQGELLGDRAQHALDGGAERAVLLGEALRVHPGTPR